MKSTIKKLMAFSLLMIISVLAFCQDTITTILTPQDQLTVSVATGFPFVIGFVYWIAAEFFKVQLAGKIKTIVSVAIVLVLAALGCWQYGYNPFTSMGFFALISFTLKLIKDVAQIDLTPLGILGWFKKGS